MHGLTTARCLTGNSYRQKAPDETYGGDVVRDKAVKKGINNRKGSVNMHVYEKSHFQTS